MIYTYAWRGLIEETKEGAEVVITAPGRHYQRRNQLTGRGAPHPSGVVLHSSLNS